MATAMPTRAGLGMLVSAIVLAATGWRARYAELVAVAIVGLFTLVVSALIVRRDPTVAVVRGPLPVRVERGTEVRFRTTVTATSRRSVAPTTLRDRVDAARVAIRLPPRQPAEVLTVGYRLATPRRGIAVIGPISVRRADPLGLVVGEHVVGGTMATLLVHPRVVPLHGRRFIERAASTESALRWGSDPASGFQSLRPYAAGDDTRTIHWPTSARTGTIMVREYTDPHRPTLTVVLTTEAADYSHGSFDEAADVAASLCLHALRSGVDVTLVTTDRANPGSPRPLREDIEALDVLARVGLTAGADTRPLGEIVHRTPRATCAFIVSGRSEEGLSRLADLADRVMYVSIAATADGLPRIIGSRGDDVMAPTAEAFARWWASAS